MNAHNALISLVLYSLLLWPSAAGAGAEPWKRFQSTYTVISYKDEGALRILNRRLKTRWLKIQYDMPGALGLNESVALKMDMIWVNVMRILDMHPVAERVGIDVYGDADDLQKTYSKVDMKGGLPPAAYSRFSRKVYLLANDVDTNVVAHEFAHAVIEDYLGPTVPKSVHEILAQYVDVHLYDE